MQGVKTIATHHIQADRHNGYLVKWSVKSEEYFSELTGSQKQQSLAGHHRYVLCGNAAASYIPLSPAPEGWSVVRPPSTASTCTCSESDVVSGCVTNALATYQLSHH